MSNFLFSEKSSKMKTEKWLSISNTGHSRGSKSLTFLKLALVYSCSDPQFLYQNSTFLQYGQHKGLTGLGLTLLVTPDNLLSASNCFT